MVPMLLVGNQVTQIAIKEVVGIVMVPMSQTVTVGIDGQVNAMIQVLAKPNPIILL